MSTVTGQHIVQQPRFIFFIKIAQIFLAALILALTSFSASRILSLDGTFGFNIFCCVYTFIMSAYLIITPMKKPEFWNCWAVLALEACAAIFWLSAFATMASFAAATSWLTHLDSYSYTSTIIKRDAKSTSSSSYDYDYEYDTDYTNYGSTDAYSQLKGFAAAYKCAAAVAGLGSLIWILYVVTLVFYSISLRHHRQNPENANLPGDGSPAVEGEPKNGHEMQSSEQYV